MKRAETPLAVALRGVEKSFVTPPTFLEWVTRRPTGVAHWAVRGVDLELRAGEAVGLAGPNGAGKTTLMKIVAGLIEPTSGDVQVQGGSGGYVLGSARSFYWRLSVSENLRFFATLYGLSGRARAERIDEVLNLVELADARDRPFRELSTGMRQRLSIARGLLDTPEVLLLDEVTRALDPGVRGRILRFVRDELVDRRGVALIYSSHSLEEMSGLVDRIALMWDGTIRAEGAAGEMTDVVRDAFAEPAAA